jgi:DNA-binding FadR family transcriptional regulator
MVCNPRYAVILDWRPTKPFMPGAAWSYMAASANPKGIPSLAAQMRKITASCQSRLEEIQIELEACMRDNAPERFGRLHQEWHMLLERGSGNEVIAQLLERLNMPIHRLLFDTFYSADRLKTAVDDHRRIMDAILQGDAAKAEMAMRSHVEDGFKTLSGIGIGEPNAEPAASPRSLPKPDIQKATPLRT